MGSPTPLVRRLDELAILEVSGDDAAPWLQGQVTNDVSKAPSDPQRRGVEAAVVDVKGKMVADVWVLPRATGAGFFLLVDASARDALYERLDAFVVMEDVELAWRDDLRVVCLAGAGAVDAADAAGVAEDRVWRGDRLGVGEGAHVLVEAGEAEAVEARLVDAAGALGGAAADAEAWHAARLAAGTPAFALDYGPGRFPQEVGLRERAVSFEKGCYLGQEAIHMLEMRGKLKRRLVRLRAESPDALDEPGSRLTAADGTEVGDLGSATREGGWALAILRVEQAAPGTRIRGARGTYTVVGDAGGAPS